MEAVQQTEASLADQIRQLVAADEVELPPVPEVAVRVQELLADEDAHIGELGDTLARDPAIVAGLMRLANSAAYGGLGRIDNLTMAIQRIGLKQVGPLVTGLSLRGHFHHDSPEKKELLSVLWDHAVTTAFAARTIGQKIGADPDKAFLAGLLHDCGMVLVLTAMDHLEDRGAPTPTRDVLVELMEALHTELGHQVLLAWNLSEEIAKVALRHEEEGETRSDLLLAVCAADLITRKLGFHLDPDEEIVLGEESAIENLGLDDLTVATMMIDMEDHLAEMRQLF